MKFNQLNDFRGQCETHLAKSIDEILSAEPEKKIPAIGFVTTDDFYGFYLCWDYESTDIHESFDWQEASYPDFLYQPLVDAVETSTGIDFTTPSDEKWAFAEEILSILAAAIKQLPDDIFQKNNYRRTDILFFATMSDGDYIDEMLEASIELLNLPEVAKAYRKGWKPAMKPALIPAYEFPQEVAALFHEYTDMLIAGDASFQKYLDIQNYDDELMHLETKYGLPNGRLYLATAGGIPAGCIGLKKIDDENCEMKRLYVRPKFRGNHISDLLIAQIIADAREIGYRHMLLDTLPFLQSAIRIYRKYGFYEIPCYNDSPMDTSIYMKLDL